MHHEFDKLAVLLTRSEDIKLHTPGVSHRMIRL